MTLQATSLIGFFDSHREHGEPLVLATVIGTRGSTYSKVGAQMLIDADGLFHGMLSGGCLEGDLAERARTVIESGEAQAVIYDLARDDELWGMGVGCDGEIRVLLSPLSVENGYAPFANMAEALCGREEATFQLSVPGHEPGEIDISIVPAPRVLVLGAGLDAEPVVRFAAELGWRVTVADHRPAYIDSGNFAVAESCHCVPAEELSQAVDVSSFDMAIVMSHHLASDRAYLGQLAGSGMTYIGLLGPRARRDRLLSELGDDAGDLTERLHGPAGIDIGGRGPAPIALSIIAEMQQAWESR